MRKNQVEAPETTPNIAQQDCNMRSNISPLQKKLKRIQGMEVPIMSIQFSCLIPEQRD